VELNLDCFFWYCCCFRTWCKFLSNLWTFGNQFECK